VKDLKYREMGETDLPLKALGLEKFYLRKFWRRIYVLQN